MRNYCASQAHGRPLEATYTGKFSLGFIFVIFVNGEPKTKNEPMKI